VLAGVEAGNPFAIAQLEKSPKLEWPYHYHAFGDLSTERQIGMSVGPIPYSAVRAMAVEDNLSRAEAATFHYVIRALDNHFLSKQAKRAEQQAAKSSR